MIALDASVIVRYLVRDDPVQAESVRVLLEGLTAQRPGFVSRDAVVELVSVLEHAYGFARPEIARVLVELAATDGLVIEAADDVMWAAYEYREAVRDFADLMMIAAAARAGAAPLYTLDPRRARLDGAVLVEPAHDGADGATPPAGETSPPASADEADEADGADETDAPGADAGRGSDKTEARIADAEARAQPERGQHEAADARAATLEARVATIEAERDQLQRNFRDMRSGALVNGAASSGQDDVEKPSPVNVAGAVKIAQLEFPDRLCFLPEAIKSAADSNYLYPDDVYAAFEALAELAGERAAGSLGRRVQDWLRERGFDYAAHESQTTMGMYGGERTYRYGGAKIAMEEHIKFGVGPDPRLHLRIHLWWHDGESRWIIGHVGRHLTNTKTS